MGLQQDENRVPRGTSRRTFFGALLATGAAAAVPPRDLAKRVCLFTDHLAGIPLLDVARMLAELKVTGPDLTVRPGGLVSRETAARDLPGAVARFRDHGLSVPMITTSITSVTEGRPLMEIAARAGIPYCKLGYFKYDDMDHWRQARDQVASRLGPLVEAGKNASIRAALHTHSGPIVGGLTWDALELLEPFDKDWIGIYFDPAHAVIEGGKNGWNYSLRRAAHRILMLSIKDFIWEKVNGQWTTRWVPLGQGMVPFDQVIPLLARLRFPGPVSLHIEYDPGGKTLAERYDRSLEAAARDLQFLRARFAALSSPAGEPL